MTQHQLTIVQPTAFNIYSTQLSLKITYRF